MPVSAAISAAGSLGGAALNYFGTQGATKAQTALGQQALTQEQAMFQAAQGALNPYIGAGQSVLPTLQKLLTPGASQTATLSQVPGFQFQSQWSNQATTNALAPTTHFTVAATSSPAMPMAAAPTIRCQD
jgi:hypothetical protein